MNVMCRANLKQATMTAMHVRSDVHGWQLLMTHTQFAAQGLCSKLGDEEPGLVHQTLQGQVCVLVDQHGRPLLHDLQKLSECVCAHTLQSNLPATSHATGVATIYMHTHIVHDSPSHPVHEQP